MIGTRRGKLILASASPRRRDLLARAGLEFEIEPSEVSEELASPLEPEPAAEELACRKALAVAAAHSGEEAWVIGSDTVVALGSGADLLLLGKPADAGEARTMLEGLSASCHRVVTGVAVIDCTRFGEEGACRSAWERTWVAMRRILPEEVDAYVGSGEWRGKAGGYAIQENADAFVTGLEEGGFDNVVGLPVELTLGLLRAAGALEGR